MEEQNCDVDYSSVVEILLSMFGEVLCKDAILSIVESCGGDLEEAANIIMNITTGDEAVLIENQGRGNSIENIAMDSNKLSETSNSNATNVLAQKDSTRQGTSQTGTMAYSQAILRAPSSGAIPKQIPKKPEVKRESKEIEHILKLHAEGTRTLIILRGAAGSGKTYLARSIIDKIYNSHVPGHWSSHIFSTDDYFLKGGVYCYDKHRLVEAHAWNQKRSYVAMSSGISPVIIDNTNLEIWEMLPYVAEGVKTGYVLILLQPSTPWAKKINQLVRRNIHNVPYHSLDKMLKKFQPTTSEELLIKIGFGHYINSTPSIKRLIPAFKPMPVAVSEPKSNSAVKQDNQSNSCVKEDNEKNMEKQMENSNFHNNSSVMFSNEQIHEASTNKTGTQIAASEFIIKENFAVYKEVEKQLEEAAMIENEWDNGESWDDNSESKQVGETKRNITNDIQHLPQRKMRSGKYSKSEKLLPEMENVQDWTIFMPKWNEEHTPKAEQLSAPQIEKSTTGTSMEIGDTVISNSKNPFKVISATARDINEFFINDRNLKIPDRWMLDKSTSTINEVMHIPRCKNEDKHFIEFRKLFKHIPKADLRDIFDNCHGDVNWAVDIVLSDISQEQSGMEDVELLHSDADENCENIECDCVAAYNVIPDQNVIEEIEPEISTVPIATTSSPLPAKRKIKKDNNQSDAFSQLKQKIEQTIVISEEHYSKHSLKIRNFRRGEKQETEEAVKTTENDLTSDTNKENMPSTTNIPDSDLNYETLPRSSNNYDESDDETISTVDEAEKTISIDVTKDLMSQLDEQFGWKEMVDSSNISTKINVPISILNELNAIWIESLLFQMEENSKQLEIMVKQDEEFARQMAQKEAELLQTTNEPGIPDFKQIMDMDYALSLYHKEVAQWRNNEPSDLAARLSRDKLKKLFPDISEECLVEILMAHDNNFKMTVEALLISTGKSDVLLEHNGISKFIIDNENEQREMLLKKEEDEVLSDSEWPRLPSNVEINMDLVRKYREEAENHLKFRNMSHQKAQELMRRGMTPAASFYSEIAAYHKMKYERSNSYAAASLIHLHVRNRKDTVDLHFMRVNEAKVALDLFIDAHIQILRNKPELKNKKLFFITGRGLHSIGGPKIKPAVKKRLRERGMYYNETNPGLLSSKISVMTPLADELG